MFLGLAVRGERKEGKIDKIYGFNRSNVSLSHLSVSVLGVHASNFQKLVAIKLYISELKYNLDVFTVQMLDED